MSHQKTDLSSQEFGFGGPCPPGGGGGSWCPSVSEVLAAKTKKEAEEEERKRKLVEAGEIPADIPADFTSYGLGDSMAETTVANTILRQAPFIEDQQRKLLDFAEGVSNVRIDLPRQQVAAFDPLTEDAFTTGRGIGQYQPLVTTAQGTVGTGLGTLQDLSGGVGQQFAAGAGTASRAIQELQDRGLYGPEQRFGQAGEALSGVSGQYAAGPGYTAQAFDPGTVSPYFNQFEDAAVQQALSDISRQGDIAQNQLSAQAVGAGAFGGSRQGLQSAELGRNILEQQGRTASGMRQAGFQNAMQQAMATFADQQRRAQAESQFGTQVGQQSFEQARQRQLALGQGLGALGGQQAGAQAQFAQTLGGLGSGLAGIGAGQAQEAARLGLGIGSLGTTQANIASAAQNMLGQQSQLQSSLGALGQTQHQRILDAQYQGDLRQAYEPYQRFNWMSDILKPTIGSASSTLATTTAPSPSGLSQLIGGGVAALGLNKALGNPIGSLFGS